LDHFRTWSMFQVINKVRVAILVSNQTGPQRKLARF